MSHTADSITWTFTIPENYPFNFANVESYKVIIHDISRDLDFLQGNSTYSNCCCPTVSYFDGQIFCIHIHTVLDHRSLKIVCFFIRFCGCGIFLHLRGLSILDLKKRYRFPICSILYGLLMKAVDHILLMQMMASS